jgi:hypothetical protein
VDGLLEPEAGHVVLAALEPLARPADAHDTRSGGQRTADALGGMILVFGAIMPIAMFAPRYAALAWALLIPLRLVVARVAHR